MKVLLLFVIIASTVAGFPDVTTIYRLHEQGVNDSATHWIATVDVHARHQSRGYPFLLNNGSLIGPNLDVDFSDCLALPDGCGWRRSDNWVLKRKVSHEVPTSLPLGTTKYTDFLNNSESKPRYFFENLEMVFKVANASNQKRNMFLMLDDPTEKKVYVVVHGIDRPPLAYEDEEIEALSIYKCKAGEDEHLEKCSKEKNEKMDAIKWLPNDEFKITVFNDKTKLIIKFNHNGSDYKPIEWRTSIKEISTYRLKLSGMSASVTSRGDRPMFFSLEGTEGTMTSEKYAPSASEATICVDIDCFMPDNTSIAVGVKIENIFYPLNMTKSNKLYWNKARFTFSLPAEVQTKNRTIEIKAKRSSEYDRLYIQRVASCSGQERTEDVLVLEPKEYDLSIAGEGFSIAQELPDGDATPLTCRNGGFWDSEYKSCNCPAGFNGTMCEEGCGPNRYGEDCGGMCSHTKRACLGKYLCRPNRPCECAPGLHGKFCNKKCDEGFYGAGCKQSCGNCAAGTCNIYTGTCHQGCKPGYTLPLCQYTYNYLKDPPSVKKVDSDDKIVDVKANLQHVLGDTKHSPSFYQLQYRIAVDEPDSQRDAAKQLWEKQEMYKISSGLGEIPVGRITTLEPGRKYEIRVVLIDGDSGSYQGSLVPVYYHTTSCEVPDSLMYNVEVNPLQDDDGLQVKWKYSTDDQTKQYCSVVRFEIHVKLCWQWEIHRIDPLRHVTQEYDVTDLLPGERYEVKMRAVTIRGVANFSPTQTATVRDQVPLGHVTDLTAQLVDEDCRVEWNPPRHDTKDLDHYLITYECIRLLACPQNETPKPCGEEKRTSTPDLWFRILDLVPFAQYNISVNVVDKDGHEGEPLSIQVTTNAKKPSVTLTTSDKKPKVEESSFTVYWNAPDSEECRNLNGAIIGYSCDIERKQGFFWKAIKSKTTLQPEVTFDGLEPSTEYQVKVYLVTTAGKSEELLNIPVRTTAPPPGAVRDLVVYKRTGTTLGVRWSDPDSSEKLKSFSVMHTPSGRSGGNTFTLDYSKKCSAWPDKHCYLITDLTSDTLYDIQVSARNNEIEKDGEPQFLKREETKEVLSPGAPSDLEAIETNPTSLALRWKIPELLHGTLSYFRYEAEKVGPTADGKFVPGMVIANDEEPTYSATISGLEPNSEYLVSVYAHNRKFEGPAVSKKFNTTT